MEIGLNVKKVTDLEFGHTCNGVQQEQQLQEKQLQSIYTKVLAIFREHIERWNSMLQQ